MNNKALRTKLNQRIKTIEHQLAEVKAELSKEPVPEPAKVMGQYRPEDGDGYWYINGGGMVYFSRQETLIEALVAIGNSFETREEAELALEFKKLCVPTAPMPTSEHWYLCTLDGRYSLKGCSIIYQTDGLRYKLGMLGTDKERLQKLCDFLNDHREFLQ